MRRMNNIEKSAFRPGEYVGYASGRVYRIKRNTSNSQLWDAYMSQLWDAYMHSGIVDDIFQQFYLCKTLTQLQSIFESSKDKTNV